MVFGNNILICFIWKRDTPETRGDSSFGYYGGNKAGKGSKAGKAVKQKRKAKRERENEKGKNVKINHLYP